MRHLTVEGICAGYGRQSVLNGVSFQLADGCLMGILGANGSGKTTLLKAICGIVPHQGRCTLDGRVLEGLSARQLARQVSYIPQRSGITMDIPALDVVLMGFNPWLGLLERPTKAMMDAARQALAQVGLAGREEANYQHLSEGQKQLCILARTLVSGSALLLLDEPESALDFRFRHQMLALLRRWTARENRSALVALHDPALAFQFCDQLLLLAEGKILGSIQPKTDPLDKMERLLGRVYGPVSLHRCTSPRGGERIVMLWEDEE